MEDEVAAERELIIRTTLFHFGEIAVPTAVTDVRDVAGRSLLRRAQSEAQGVERSNVISLAIN